MASLLNSLLGQQEAPDLQTLSSQDILAEMMAKLPQLKKINDQWNMDQATGGATAQRAGEDIYDPNRGAIRERSGSLILDSLQNPYAIPPQILQMLRQQGFEGAAGSGLNTSDAGRTGVASMLGTKALDYGNSIINRGAAYGSNTANLYNPSAAVTPGDVGSMFSNQNAMQNSFNTYMSDLNYQNDMNLINRPLEIGGKVGNIAGQIVGGVFGTNNGMGSMMSGMGGGGGAPQISAGTYGGAGQPSWNTANWALPGRG